MKKQIVLIGLLSLLAFQCRKGTETDCLKVKVIRVTCASTVVQAMNNSSIGEDGWIDSFSGSQTVYNNVFQINNICDIPSGYEEGDVVYITIVQPQFKSCGRCKMNDSPPSASYNVIKMSERPCDK